MGQSRQSSAKLITGAGDKGMGWPSFPTVLLLGHECGADRLWYVLMSVKAGRAWEVWSSWKEYCSHEYGLLTPTWKQLPCTGWVSMVSQKGYFLLHSLDQSLPCQQNSSFLPSHFEIFSMLQLGSHQSLELSFATHGLWVLILGWGLRLVVSTSWKGMRTFQGSSDRSKGSPWKPQCAGFWKVLFYLDPH